ncbi:MAG: hypothetical protein ING75_16950 [Rhodocyclaceae bacterium]|nr:hypothetical protein [Rhodocyclaceae bacterium]
MTATLTSISHYHTPARGQQSARVLGYIADHPRCTRQEISVGTGLPINCICGRVRELLDCAAIEECGKKECSVTHNNVSVLRVVPLQRELFAA